MKVLMTARFPVGGIRTYLRQVYSQPVFQDCEITLLAPTEDLGDFLAQHIPEQRLSVRNVPDATGQFLRQTRAAIRADNFDLFHSHGLTTGVLGEIARAGTGIPHLMTMHDVFLPTTFNGLGGRIQQVGLNLLMRRCDAIHAVSEDCASNFREYLPLVKEERVHAILNGIDTEAIVNAVPIDAHAQLGLSSDTRLIGFFGRFMAQKGFRSLVDAIGIIVQQADHPPFKVVTFGWGGFIREDFHYLQDKGLGEYFVQQPHTDDQYRWMKAMDCVVMPSRWEACGLVAMEALVAGVVLIGTDCIGLREVLRGSPAVQFNPGDSVALSSAIAVMLGKRCNRASVQFQEAAAKRFDIRICGNKLRTLYDSLAESKNASASP